MEQAILDVATSDPVSGKSLWFDATVVVAHSDNAGLLASRVRKDGRAAGDAAADKRRRYAAAGAALIPLAFEDGGRPSEDAVAGSGGVGRPCPRPRLPWGAPPCSGSRSAPCSSFATLSWC